MNDIHPAAKLIGLSERYEMITKKIEELEDKRYCLRAQMLEEGV